MSTTIVHVRFAPDGTVTEIGERPEGLSADTWFKALAANGGLQTLSGGRGVFRLSREEIDALKGATSH